jgi:hypothetical protein
MNNSAIGHQKLDLRRARSALAALFYMESIEHAHPSAKKQVL